MENNSRGNPQIALADIEDMGIEIVGLDHPDGVTGRHVIVEPCANAYCPSTRSLYPVDADTVIGFAEDGVSKDNLASPLSQELRTKQVLVNPLMIAKVIADICNDAEVTRDVERARDFGTVQV